MTLLFFFFLRQVCATLPDEELDLDLALFRLRAVADRAVSAMFGSLSSLEPRRHKTYEVTVRPAKTRISQGIRPVWSKSSLCGQWVAKGPRFLHADNEDSDQTWWMPRRIWVFAGRIVALLVLSCRGSVVISIPIIYYYQGHYVFTIRSEHVHIAISGLFD